MPPKAPRRSRIRTSESADNPACEELRLAALHRYHILDTPSDSSLDRITQLAAEVFEVPIALISFVDRDRVWFKSRCGFAPPEIARQGSLCALGLSDPDGLVIPDATQNAMTADNGYVTGDFALRFYASAPIRTAEGLNLGCLCIADFAPRSLSDSELKILDGFSRLITDRLEELLGQRQDKILHEQLSLAHEKIGLAIEAGSIGVWELNQPGNHIVWNAGMHQIYGLAEGEFQGTREHWRSFVHRGDAQRVKREFEVALAAQGSFCSQFCIVRPDGDIRQVLTYATIVDCQEGPFSAVGICIDISDQYRKINAQLRNQHSFAAARGSFRNDASSS